MQVGGGQVEVAFSVSIDVRIAYAALPCYGVALDNRPISLSAVKL